MVMVHVALIHFSSDVQCIGQKGNEGDPSPELRNKGIRVLLVFWQSFSFLLILIFADPEVLHYIFGSCFI